MLLPACWCSLCQPCSEPAHIQMQRQILTASSPISEGMRQPLEGEGEEVVASLLKGHHTLAAASGSHLLLLILPLPPVPNSAVFKHTSKVPGGPRGAPAAARFLLSVRVDCSQLWCWESGNLLALLPGEGNKEGSQVLSPLLSLFYGILAVAEGQLCPPPSIHGARVVLPGITSVVMVMGDRHVPMENGLGRVEKRKTKRAVRFASLG